MSFDLFLDILGLVVSYSLELKEKDLRGVSEPSLLNPFSFKIVDLQIRNLVTHRVVPRLVQALRVEVKHNLSKLNVIPL
jgi:hypothetical protein